MFGSALIAVVLSVTPANGGLLTPPQIVIDAQTGFQSDPHVDNDLAAYSSFVDSPVLGPVEQIRYFTFSTNSPGAIPNVLPDGGLARDLLSDVDQGRIVFTRIFDLTGRSGIMLFDSATLAVTELAPAPNSQRMGVALGSQTAVFIDYGLSGNGTGELMALNLSGNTLTRLTVDTIDDFNPAVSPDGNVITWERCPISGANCDIYTATRSGSIWIINAVSTSIFNESQADTNGTQVVFQREATGPTAEDIVIAPVGGGAETVLEIVGDERNASIRGSLIAFEHREPVAGANSDIMVVDLANNRLFQITNTPTVNETLNDITLLSTGEVRLVWQANDGVDHIYGATFMLPAVVVPDAGVADAGTPPVDAGVADAGTPVDAGVCVGGRTTTIQATRFYSPTHSVDGTASFAPPFEFLIPATLPVVSGGSGHGWSSLSFVTAGKQVVCTYRGGASAASYAFVSCKQQGSQHDGDDDDDDDDDDEGHGHGDGHGCGNSHHWHPPTPTPTRVWHVGDSVLASSITLHVQKGTVSLGPTVVRLTLTEPCSFGTIAKPLDAAGAPEGAETAGCSSTGDAMVPMFAMLAFAALLLRRPASIRLVARQERRKLPR